jgi:hypothetical protein
MIWASLGVGDGRGFIVKTEVLVGTYATSSLCGWFRKNIHDYDEAQKVQHSTPTDASV